MPRNVQVDALRGIAALLVLTTHATESFVESARAVGLSLWLYEISHALDFGRTGVIVFFIISGYVVSNTLSNPHTSITRFIVRRAFRLYPLFWLSAVGALFFLLGDVSLIRILANLTMTPTVFNQEPLMGLYWTLETELVYYSIAMVLFFFSRLRHSTTLFICVVLLILCFAGFMFQIIQTPTNLSLKSLPLNLCFMLVGALTHVAHSAHQEENKSRQEAMILAATIVLSLSPSAYSLLRYFSTSSADDLRWAFSYPLAVFIFFAVLATTSRFTKPLASLGLISYSMYLMHPLALALLNTWLPNPNDIVAVGGLPGVVVLATVLTTLISIATYNVVELPFIKMSKRLAN